MGAKSSQKLGKHPDWIQTHHTHMCVCPYTSMIVDVYFKHQRDAGSLMSVDLHRVTPVGGAQFGNIAVEVASTRWMPPRWPISSLTYLKEQLYQEDDRENLD